MRRFAAEFALSDGTRVLDVGGTPDNWRLLEVKPNLTILNMPRAGEEIGDTAWVAGDGRRLPFRDGAFDIVFSNSVIEHVGEASDQAAFAGEIARVGRRYWVQTPNRWFPLEQHLLTPFVHWLPKHWQAPIVRRFTIWAALIRPSPDRRRFYLEHYLREVRLLDANQLARLFPDAAIQRERFLGLSKSLLAIRHDTLRD